MRGFASIALSVVSVQAFAPVPNVKLVRQQQSSCLRMASVETETQKDIIDTAIGAGQFNTLAVALEKADLVVPLKGEGPFTVFAPTDEAFSKIPKNTLEAILDDKPTLLSILKYHVVSGAKLSASDVSKLDSADTLEGSKLKIQASGGQVKVDKANVVRTDISSRNGIIHVIDSVLLPPAVTQATKAPSAQTSKEQKVDENSLPSLEVRRAGATAPFGYFDPLGISEGITTKELKKWRESELKHGRIAMLAVVGVLVQEAFSPFYNPEGDLGADPGPAVYHWQKLTSVNPFLTIFLIIAIATLESFTINKGWESPSEYSGPIAPLRDEYIAGDFEFDPLGLAPRQDKELFLNMRSKELNNGRLAMFAWWGMMVQELITNKKILGGASFFGTSPLSNVASEAATQGQYAGQ